MNRRREIADRVVARWKAHGIALDAVPDYMSLVEMWIDGAIDGAEMHRRYLAVLQAQRGVRTAHKIPEMPDMADGAAIEIDPARPDPAEAMDQSLS